MHISLHCFSGIAVHTILPASKLPVVNETIYSKGEVLLQNLPSIVCGWVMNAQPNEYILDMCAAPGNKTTHLAEMSNDQVRTLKVEISTKSKDIDSFCWVQPSCRILILFPSTPLLSKT